MLICYPQWAMHSLVQTIVVTTNNLIEKLQERADKSSEENVQSDEDFYNDIYKEVKSITDILKLELPPILHLGPLAQLKGDSD